MRWRERKSKTGGQSGSGPRSLKVLAIPGSLRRQSFNRRLAYAAAAVAPSGLSVSIHEDLDSVPLFNEDLEAAGVPDGVAQLVAAVAQADGVLLATPEYNQSVPGVVKNMVDWLSRAEPAVLAAKPVGLMGATIGQWGTRLAQAALRQTLTACRALTMPAPQLYLRTSQELFDRNGLLTDARTAALLTDFMTSFKNWIEVMQPRHANGGENS
ncbi:MAG: NADPH-dependent FMN reductase [Alphaproteobacteria bacterium]